MTPDLLIERVRRLCTGNHARCGPVIPRQ